MKRFFAAILLTMAMFTSAAANCDPLPGTTQSPPGCDRGGNGLTDPNQPDEPIGVLGVVDPVTVDDPYAPLVIETIRLAFFIW